MIRLKMKRNFKHRGSLKAIKVRSKKQKYLLIIKLLDKAHIKNEIASLMQIKQFNYKNKDKNSI